MGHAIHGFWYIYPHLTICGEAVWGLLRFLTYKPPNVGKKHNHSSHMMIFSLIFRWHAGQCWTHKIRPWTCSKSSPLTYHSPASLTSGEPDYILKTSRSKRFVKDLVSIKNHRGKKTSHPQKSFKPSKKHKISRNHQARTHTNLLHQPALNLIRSIIREVVRCSKVTPAAAAIPSSASTAWTVSLQLEENWLLWSHYIWDMFSTRMYKCVCMYVM